MHHEVHRKCRFTTIRAGTTDDFGCSSGPATALTGETGPRTARFRRLFQHLKAVLASIIDNAAPHKVDKIALSHSTPKIIGANRQGNQIMLCA